VFDSVARLNPRSTAFTCLHNDRRGDITGHDRVAHGKLLRVGGALKRIAADAPDYTSTTMVSLAAFLQIQSPTDSAGRCRTTDKPTLDLKNAFKAIGELKTTIQEDMPVDLSGTCLRLMGVIDDANMSNVDFTGSDLSNTMWTLTSFRDTSFDIANLDSSAFGRAGLSSATFCGTDLSRTYFVNSTFKSA
jgi:hypothetical protein